MNIYDKIFRPRVIEFGNGKQVEEKKRSRMPLIILIFIIAIIVSVKITGFNFTTLIQRGKNF